MTRQGETLPPGADVVAVWIALLRAGVPPATELPRRVWDNALRAVCGVESSVALRYKSKTARDYGLVTVSPGHRGKPGTVVLHPVGSPGQFVPIYTDLDALAPAPAVVE